MRSYNLPTSADYALIGAARHKRAAKAKLQAAVAEYRLAAERRRAAEQARADARASVAALRRLRRVIAAGG